MNWTIVVSISIICFTVWNIVATRLEHEDTIDQRIRDEREREREHEDEQSK